jgi:hypothetical protein
MLLTPFSTIWLRIHGESRVELTYLYLIEQHGVKIAHHTTLYALLVALAAAAIAIFSLFSYRNRLRQMQLGLINTLMMCGVLGLNVGLFVPQAEKALGITDIQANPWEAYQWGFFLPIIALIANILANRFIRRDELLVRASDRMR